MDIAVRNHEGGERDLTVEEITGRARALLGARASTYKRNPRAAPADKLCVVAAFLDDAVQLAPTERAEVVLGEGASFAEAFARAQGAIARGFGKVRRADGTSRVVNLADYDICPVLA